MNNFEPEWTSRLSTKVFFICLTYRNILQRQADPESEEGSSINGTKTNVAPVFI